MYTTEEKVVALYEYTKKLVELKYRVITDVNKQLFSLPLNTTPQYEQYTTVSFRDYVEAEDSELDDVEITPLLSVQKPDFQPCPNPSDIILPWIRDGWDNYKNSAEYIEEKEKSERFSANAERVNSYKNWRKERKDWLNSIQPSGNLIPCPKPNEIFLEWIQGAWDDPQSKCEPMDSRAVTIKFSDNKERVTEYNKWYAKRESWVIRQKKIASVRDLFMRLFNVYTDLNRESETQELMVGSAMLTVFNNSQINHPILLKRVSIELDAKNNIISVNDIDSLPEIYTMLLTEVGKITDINIPAIAEGQSMLAQEGYHPLDRNNTSDFIKAFAHLLSPKTDFIQFDGKDKNLTSGIKISMNQPMLFVRKKIDGTLKALETIIDTIKTTHEYPKPIGELVCGGKIEMPDFTNELTIEERLAYTNGESADILLCKAANKEQLEAAERINRYNAVLVQGPPGTGKTHTIANLMGHFLSQGQSVLVTSHTSKALSVVQDKLPKGIQSLCVTLTGDDSSRMVRSIDGITEFMGSHTAVEMKELAESIKVKRQNVIEELNRIRKKLYQIRYSEFKPIVFGGDEYSPKEIAEFVRENSEELSYIPGKVELYHALPVTIDDLMFLYKYNENVSLSEELELSANLPNPDTLPTIADFQNLYNDFKFATEDEKAPDELRELISTPDSTQINFILDNFVEPLSNTYDWKAIIAADGKRGAGYRNMWIKLCDLIRKTSKFAAENAELLFGKHIHIESRINPMFVCDNAEKLIKVFSKGKPSPVVLMLNKDIKTIISEVKINNLPLETKKDCQSLVAFSQLEVMRDEITFLWDELFADTNMPNFRTLGKEPESIADKFVDIIYEYLDWSDKSFSQFKSLIEETGLSFDTIFPLNYLESERKQFHTLFSTIANKLPILLNSVDVWVEYRKVIISKKDVLSKVNKRKLEIQSLLSGGSLESSEVCKNLRKAVDSLDKSLYTEQYNRLCSLYNKYDSINRRSDILNRIKKIAPFWAEAIENRRGVHGSSVCPNNIVDAWKWKQFAGIIDEITGQPFESLQQENALLSVELRKVTTELVACKSWFHLLCSTETDLSMRQALQGWKITVRKIGKGTGKNAPMYRRQAMEQMALCQKAVPAWVMPINKAMDMLDPSINKFDVIIVDEASQCDISSLGILYMAKKIIVVGDDKQVSPLAIGADIERINALRDMYIKNKIPNWHLYESKTSLYDIAQTTFQPLLLREHFRCLPEIIGYSNKLSYDYKIKPLRDCGTAKVAPSVVNYRVTDGIREGKQKRNIKEADTIVAIIRACIEQPEYDGMTFGIISLLGNEQAAYMQTQILEKIPAQVIEERQILCGNASHFQGDERDIILLSLVDSNEGDGPLRLTGEGVDSSTKQRYNVATSRAKEQLWVVHSLDYTKDLKEGDMRRDLIEYANNPNAFLQVVDAIEKKSESPFEEVVAKSLVADNYNIKQQYAVGSYRLDMVVSDGDNKVALECDGEAWHSTEAQIRSDMERQAILERIGWKFIRIRGSEYYHNPDKAMEVVKSKLTELGIMPNKTNIESPITPSSNLLERVKIRANQIIDDEKLVDQDENETIEVKRATC